MLLIGAVFLFLLILGAPVAFAIGLSLVAAHVRRHDGRVWVEERPGGGTRVVVELPGVDR